MPIRNFNIIINFNMKEALKYGSFITLNYNGAYLNG